MHTTGRRSATALSAALLLAACSRDGGNLWERRFDPTANGPAANVTTSGLAMPLGFWEGDVFSGSVRLQIEAARVTLALRCDSAGKKLAQGSARVVVDDGAPGAMVLQADLAGGDADCGFKFLKGDRLTARAVGPYTLDVAFGNASSAKLTKLADL